MFIDPPYLLTPLVVPTPSYEEMKQMAQEMRELLQFMPKTKEQLEMAARYRRFAGDVQRRKKDLRVLQYECHELEQLITYARLRQLVAKRHPQLTIVTARSSSG